MDTKALRDAVRDMSCALRLERKIAGVKFVFDEEEFAKAGARKLKGRMAYCVMVMSAMTGKSLKATFDNMGCMGGARALGIAVLDEMSSSGRFYYSLGLYQDLGTAKDVQRKVTFCSHRPYGVMVKPLEEYDEEPDVVLVVTDPYNAMRIIQGYAYAFGFNTSFRMSGNQAICSECTSVPFESNDINVSLLCSGTRFKAKWAEKEMGIGFPFNRFPSIVKGIYATLNPTEPDGKKAEIEAMCRKMNREVPKIRYGRNYWTGLNPGD